MNKDIEMNSALTSADPSGWYEFACESLGRQVAHWDGQYLRGGGYTFYQPNCRNFRRLFTESDVAALREELTALRDEVKRLKSQPYEMRRADRPDCEGLWANREGSVLEIYNAKTSPSHAPPFYYIGPLPIIPVIVEQQPPKVVKVRCKKTGEVCRAIPRVVAGDALSYCLLNDDGTTKCFVTTNSVEEVQP